jgi:hypothetical protein
VLCARPVGIPTQRGRRPSHLETANPRGPTSPPRCARAGSPTVEDDMERGGSPYRPGLSDGGCRGLLRSPSNADRLRG